MAYEIIIKPSAEKAFGKLPKALQVKILEALEQLSVNPRPSGVKKLKSTFNFYRIRVGEYRVIYSIKNQWGQTQLIFVFIGCLHNFFSN